MKFSEWYPEIYPENISPGKNLIPEKKTTIVGWKIFHTKVVKPID